jgi:hypothetical protein
MAYIISRSSERRWRCRAKRKPGATGPAKLALLHRRYAFARLFGSLAAALVTTIRTRYQRTYGAFLQQSLENLALAEQTLTLPVVAMNKRSQIPAITLGMTAPQEWGSK